MNEWLNLFKRTIDSEFKDRVEFIGLQGSHAREEADHGSDIDVVVILDKLSYDDLKRFDEISDTLLEWAKEIIVSYGSDKLLKNCIEATNVEFVPVDKCDGEMIAELSGFAGRIVKEHFDKIIDPAQNDYMINKFQSVDAITDQIKSGYRYYIVRFADGDKAGFLAFYPKGGMMYLSKFYTAAEHRGKHLARRMLTFIADETKRENLSAVFLNVNRNNLDVISIYEHLGFKITGEEKNDIGGGFVMDDYVMTYLV